MPTGIPQQNCKACGRHSSEVGHLSATKLCTDCGLRRLEANHIALKEHRGLYFDHWRTRCLASFGVTLPHE